MPRARIPDDQVETALVTRASRLARMFGLNAPRIILANDAEGVIQAAIQFIERENPALLASAASQTASAMRERDLFAPLKFSATLDAIAGLPDAMVALARAGLAEPFQAIREAVAAHEKAVMVDIPDNPQAADPYAATNALVEALVDWKGMGKAPLSLDALIGEGDETLAEMIDKAARENGLDDEED